MAADMSAVKVILPALATLAYRIFPSGFLRYPQKIRQHYGEQPR